MVSLSTDASQGESCPMSAPTAPVPFDRSQARNANTVFKSGPLFISSKGIGWTSWKKRWFILTRTSLVFFRSDPNALSHKGGEVNLTLGGIDLNNSGSVVVKADKKLLTVLFPNGGDGRGFTLKAETSEDMYEWKTALENALAHAPSANLALGQSGIFQNDANVTDIIEGSVEQWRERPPMQSLVVGRSILLALEDVDGSPSFLEKALRFIEQHGIKVEGILRQSADVEEVKQRIEEYEQGKTEFSPDEDAHVVSDCVKDDFLQRESHSTVIYSDSESNNSEDSMEDEVLETVDDGYHDAENDVDPEDDSERSFSGSLGESSDHEETDLYDYKVYAGADSDADAQNDGHLCRSDQKSISEVLPSSQELVMENLTENHTLSGVFASECHDPLVDASALGSPKREISFLSSSSCLTNTYDKSNAAMLAMKIPAIWGQTSARKNLEMDSIDSSSDDEIMIQRLEITKNDLQKKIAKEAKGNVILQASLERRKQALHERRLALEQDVARLQEQLQREDLRTTKEAGLNVPPQNYMASSSMDVKIRAELEEIAFAEADVVNLKQKAADLHLQLNQQCQHVHSSFCKTCGHDLHAQKHEITRNHQLVLGTVNDGTKKDEVKDALLICDSRAVKTQYLFRAENSMGNNRI